MRILLQVRVAKPLLQAKSAPSQWPILQLPSRRNSHAAVSNRDVNQRTKVILKNQLHHLKGTKNHNVLNQRMFAISILLIPQCLTGSINTMSPCRSIKSNLLSSHSTYTGSNQWRWRTQWSIHTKLSNRILTPYRKTLAIRNLANVAQWCMTLNQELLRTTKDVSSLKLTKVTAWRMHN